MQKNNPCIYKAINKINGKIYIGRTINLQRRIREHDRHSKKDGGNFHADINKYGFENFDFEVIEYCDSDKLDEKEMEYIKQYRDSFGEDKIYNICKGGIGGQTHDVSGENNPQFNRKWSEEEKQRVREKLLGKPKPDGFGEKVSKALKGKKKSKEAVAKRSTPITLINIYTKEIMDFPSIADACRTLHCCSTTLQNGKITKSGFKKYSEDVEAIENTNLVRK